MRLTSRLSCIAAALLLPLWSTAHAADGNGLQTGSLELQSAGPISFGPQGILLVGDPKAAAVYAIDTGDASGDASKAMINVENLDKKVASALKVDQARIVDMAANPISGNVYLSVQSSGPDGTAALVKVDGSGAVAAVSLKDVRFSKAVLKDAPADGETGEGRRRGNPRLQSITDLAFMDGQVLVSGLGNGSAGASTIRALSFPFSEADPGTSLEIFHGAHGKVEDYSAPNTFVPFNIDGEPTVLAAYTCTPLVKFPIKQMEPGKKTRGTTVAELGNRNRPLDMIVYKKDGKDFLLMANSARGVMKVSTEDIGRSEGIEKPVPNGNTEGQSYVTIKEWEGVQQLDKLNETHAVIITQLENGPATLSTVELP
jgi:hypothetical protein